MDSNHQLPFKVGQLAESKSFIVGFRGAWFCCKIRRIGRQGNEIRASLEYLDYPGEKIGWMKLYQKHAGISREEKKPQLMLRPCFPPLYHKSQMPNPYTLSELIVIVDDDWKVGDLVDWHYEGCYWSARITQLLGNDKAQVELPDPPIGEGQSYEAFCKDLRPSLDWSPEHGWTVPTSRENETSRSCARLVQPLNEGKDGTEKYTQAGKCTGLVSCEIQSSISSNRSAGSLLPPKGACMIQQRSPCQSSEYIGGKEKDEFVEYSRGSTSCETQIPISSTLPVETLMTPNGYLHPPIEVSLAPTSASEEKEKETEMQSTGTNLESDAGGKEITNYLDKASSSHDEVEDMSNVVTKISSRQDRYNFRFFQKRMRGSESHCMTSATQADAIESSIMELEELANKIRWLKGLLHFGIRWSNAMKSSWKFLETVEQTKTDDCDKSSIG